MKYFPNGAPIPSSVPTSKKREKEHESIFGIYRGVIIRAVYPDDPKNTTKDRMEYVVRVRGQDYPNAINMRESGGIYNYKERVRKGIERSESGQISKGTFDELVDGEHVFVAFIEGYGNSPIIIGGSEHPLHGKYKKLSSDDGLKDIMEFNGIEISIDKDGNYIVQSVGKKNPDGSIANQDAVGSYIKIAGNGDIEFNTADNKVEMKSGVMNITVNGDANFNVTGAAVFKGEQGTKVGSEQSTTDVDGEFVNLAGGALPVARLNDIAVGTDSNGAPVISRIIQGSLKVRSS